MKHFFAALSLVASFSVHGADTQLCDTTLRFAIAVQEGMQGDVSRTEVYNDIVGIVKDPAQRSLLLAITDKIYEGVQASEIYRICLESLQDEKKVVKKGRVQL